ncbi:MAG: OmpA family protein [Rhizobacter sp.]
MKRATLLALCVAGGLAACAGSQRSIGQRVAVIAPPAGVATPEPSPAPAPPAPAPAPPVIAAAPSPSAATSAPPSAPPAPEPVAAAPALPQPRAEAAAEPVPSGVDVIYFKSDAYKVEPSYRPMLAAHAKRLKGTSGLHLLIQSWADRRGARDYNVALSKKRAETVARALVEEGAPADRLEVVAHGERPAATRRIAPGDRRVELQYRSP